MRGPLSAGIALLLGCGASAAELQTNTANDAAAENGAESTPVGKQNHELENLRTQLATAEGEEADRPVVASRSSGRTQRIVEESLQDHGFDGHWNDASAPPERETNRPVLTLYGDEAPAGDLIAASGDRTDGSLVGAPPTPEDHYRSGLELIQQQRFARALQVFREFSVTYPDHGYADNAVFWIGEIHFLKRQYGKALKEYQRLIKEHPGGNKIPEALYKIGRIYQQRGEHKTAKKYFRQLQKRFPHSAAARLASQEGRS